MKVLVIDVGGTNVKLLVSGEETPRKFESGPEMTAEQMVKKTKEATADWDYDAVSIGYPGPVLHNRPIMNPYNLGKGWVGFHFHRAFGCPVKVINDAAMQALGSYHKGKMLFLGLGTGLGTALVVDGTVEPMELGHLPYRKGRTYEDYVGSSGLHRLGRSKWEKHVYRIIDALSAALEPDSVVIGGGNALLLRRLPHGIRISDNSKAILGGFRMWRTDGSHRSHANGPIKQPLE